MQENNQNNYENTDFSEETEQNVAAPDDFAQNPPQNTPNTQYVPVYIPVNLETPLEKEKKQIRKTAMLAGLSCLLVSAITYVWGTVYFAVMAALGISTEQAYNLAQDPFVLQILQIIVSMFIFTLPFILVFSLGGQKISETVMLGLPKKENRLSLVLIGIGTCAFANVAVSIAGSIFSQFGFDYEVDYGDDPKGILGFLISFVATAIVPALVEEFACRGLILGSLKKYGEGFAIIASSVIFGMIHGNFEQIPFAFLIGLVLGFITVKSGSIWLSCFVHFFNNGISVVMSYLSDITSNDFISIMYNVYLVAALMVGVLGFCLLSRGDKNAFSIKNAETECSEWQKHKWFFTQCTIIILFSICLIESVLIFF